MSRIGQHIIEQEEAGRLRYNEETHTYEPITPQTDTTECHRCQKQTANPIEDSEGEAICLDCYTEQVELGYEQFRDRLVGAEQ